MKKLLLSIVLLFVFCLNSFATITELPTRNEYTPSAGSTVFTYTFKTFFETDLKAYVTPAGQEPNDITDEVPILSYSGIGESYGGTITIAPTSPGDRVTIVSDIPASRITDYQNNGDFRPAIVNNDFDRVVSIAKQTDDKVNRTLSFQKSAQSVTGLTLPEPEAGQFMRWKADLSGMENSGVPAVLVPSINYTSVANMQAATGLEIGDIVQTTAYYSTQDGGGGLYEIVAAGTGTHDGGIYIDLSGSGLQAKLFPPDILTPQLWGAYSNGTEPIATTTAYVNAIAYIESLNSGALFSPAGTYSINPNEIVLHSSYLSFTGAGRATKFLCNASADGDIFIEWVSASPTTQYPAQCSIRDFSFYSADTTYQKTFLSLVNVSEFSIHNIKSASPNFLGNGSIGVQISGRELISMNDCKIRADRPILIKPIPSGYVGASTSGFDQCHFYDNLLTADGYPNFEVETGVNLSNFTIDGYNSWNLGTYGFKWIDTTTTRSAISLSISGVRCEQGQDPTKAIIHIEHNNTVQGLTLRNVRGGDRQGFYLRDCKQVTLDNIHYTSVTGEALNVDNTVYDLAFINCFWQTGSTASITGQVLQFATSKLAAGFPLSPTAFYANEANSLTSFITGPLNTSGGTAEEYKTLDDTGTPSVAGGSLFVTSGTTAITDLDDPIGDGHLVTILALHSVTVTRGAPMRMAGAANFAMDIYDTITFRSYGSVWVEVSRSANN